MFGPIGRLESNHEQAKCERQQFNLGNERCRNAKSSRGLYPLSGRSVTHLAECVRSKSELSQAELWRPRRFVSEVRRRGSRGCGAAQGTDRILGGDGRPKT